MKIPKTEILLAGVFSLIAFSLGNDGGKRELMSKNKGRGITVEEYRRGERQIREAERKGEVSKKDADKRLIEMRKAIAREDKTKNKSKRQNRKPSGFAKPSALTEDMTQFLGLDKDVEIARNEVTKLINKYIVDNDLRNEEDKRKIQPDKKLATLLNFDVNGDEQLSYFNLQKYIKHHFVKTEPVA